MRRKLSMYVWEGVLEVYTSGRVVGLGYSAAEVLDRLPHYVKNTHKIEGDKLDGQSPTIVTVTAAAMKDPDFLYLQGRLRDPRPLLP